MKLLAEVTQATILMGMASSWQPQVMVLMAVFWFVSTLMAAGVERYLSED